MKIITTGYKYAAIGRYEGVTAVKFLRHGPVIGDVHIFVHGRTLEHLEKVVNMAMNDTLQYT